MKKKSNLAIALASGILLSSWNHNPVKIETYPKIENPIIREEEILSVISTSEMKKLENKIIDLANYRTSDFHEDNDRILLARMITGEADECSDIEKISVAYTALNRTKWGKSLKEVILQPRAYSCFNPEFDSSIFLKNPLKYNKTEFLECLKLSEEILAGKYKDPTNGATFYYNPDLVKKPDSWKDLREIGKIKVGKGKLSHHIFYKN
jgi:spore germination cell wall hydrolase CwlJ-like protein